MWNNELTLAPQKSEMIILKGLRKRDKVIVEVGEIKIKPKKEISYLGIVLDDQDGTKKGSGWG